MLWPSRFCRHETVVDHIDQVHNLKGSMHATKQPLSRPEIEAGSAGCVTDDFEVHVAILICLGWCDAADPAVYIL